ncbi:MAG: WD40/YVTN/BNR-like repeat-containing protein, partial [Bacillota bacterium]
MKIRILIIIPVFFLSGFLRSVIYPQQAFNYYINALSGLEDTKGNTHLFYKLHEFYNDKIPPREIIRLHNLDVENNKDVVFQSYGRLCNNIACIDTLILDFEFWNNNPQDFVLAGTIDAGTDPIAFIRTRDTIKHFKGIQAIYNVEVSKQESNLIFYSINASSGSPVKVLAKSTDKGRSWGSISSQYFDLVSVDPYNDKVIFGLSSNGFPVKSTDQGKTSRQVIEQYMNNMDNRIFYDADSVHIYWVSERFVYASDKTGDSLSWRKIHEGRQKVYLASDSKNTGRIFLAEGKYILFSSDYGKTFHLLCKLESPVNGIYLKPGTERLFVTTRYSIFEVTKDSLKVIKNFTLPKYLLGFYPLKRGNKWFFTETVSDYPKNIIYDMTRSVTGDTIMPNKKRYH